MYVILDNNTKCVSQSLLNSKDMSSASPQVYLELKRGVSHFSSMPFIFEKLESDGHLSLLSAAISHIISREVSYSISELKKMKVSSPSLDVPKFLLSNSSIFKENLKSIASMISFLIS